LARGRFGQRGLQYWFQQFRYVRSTTASNFHRRCEWSVDVGQPVDKPLGHLVAQIMIEREIRILRSAPTLAKLHTYTIRVVQHNKNRMYQ
jgi:hypothetical protein